MPKKIIYLSLRMNLFDFEARSPIAEYVCLRGRLFHDRLCVWRTYPRESAGDTAFIFTMMHLGPTRRRYSESNMKDSGPEANPGGLPCSTRPVKPERCALYQYRQGWPLSRHLLHILPRKPEVGSQIYGILGLISHEMN